MHVCLDDIQLHQLKAKILLIFVIIWMLRNLRNYHIMNFLTQLITQFIILIVMTIAMIAPAFLLLLDKRTYNLGLIPSIASAAYTTYSTTVSILNMKKSKNAPSPIIKQISLVNIVNALMSILVLQNTLIHLFCLLSDSYSVLLFHYIT